MPEPFIPKVITFDFYGTLMHTREDAVTRFGDILRWNGASDLDAEEFYSHWNSVCQGHYFRPFKRFRDICHESLGQTFSDYGRQGRAADIEHYLEGYKTLKPWPEVEDVLRRLAAHYPIGIVTNCDEDLFWATPQPDVPIRYHLIAEAARGYKPDGSLFRYGLREMEVASGDWLHAGQSQRTDLIGAKPLGIACAWINRYALQRDDDVPEPDYAFPDLSGLLSIGLT